MSTQLHNNHIADKTEAELQSEIKLLKLEIDKKLEMWKAAFPEEEPNPARERLRNFFIWFLSTKNRSK